MFCRLDSPPVWESGCGPSPIQSRKKDGGCTLVFTTIPCEPNKAYKTQGKPNFYNICPFKKDIVYTRFEDVITLLYVFMNVVKVFVH